jgi:hypothetical protein
MFRLVEAPGDQMLKIYTSDWAMSLTLMSAGLGTGSEWNTNRHARNARCEADGQSEVTLVLARLGPVSLVWDSVEKCIVRIAARNSISWELRTFVFLKATQNLDRHILQQLNELNV